MVYNISSCESWNITCIENRQNTASINTWSRTGNRRRPCTTVNDADEIQQTCVPVKYTHRGQFENIPINSARTMYP